MALTFQESVFNLAFDPVASAILSKCTYDDLAGIVEALRQQDAYGENAFLEKAIKKAFPSEGHTIGDYLRHQLWAAWREAQWQNNVLTHDNVRLTTVNDHYCAETAGHPTLLVSPMTTNLSDAFCLIQYLAKAHDNRPVIIYGEGMDFVSKSNPINAAWLAGDGLQGLKRIQKTLSQNGVLCTYPDFVYHGHASYPMPFFGQQRPVSAGFLSLAAKRHSDVNTMLLPCVLLPEEGNITVRFEEPIEIEFPAVQLLSKEMQHLALAELIGNTLESLIRQCGPKWLLLPTLTYDAPQMVNA